MTLAPRHKLDMEELQLQFLDLFENVEGLPPQRPVEHEIQLVGESPLPNLGMYRHSVQERRNQETSQRAPRVRSIEAKLLTLWIPNIVGPKERWQFAQLDGSPN
ncbi:unnamed protein product [Prunus brigantina]